MNEKINGWRMFFDKHAPKYMEESFTEDTIVEVDFLEEEFDLSKGCSILDVGCGTGRHAVELAKRGYEVTGIDISKNMLLEAEKKCQQEGVEVDLIQADATDFTLDKKFDGCVCLCEGAFGLLSMEEDPFTRDQKILENIFTVLKPGAKFVLTCLNGMKMIRQYSDQDVAEGRFDPLGIVEVYPLANILEEAPKDIMIKEKGFLATELRQLFKSSGLKIENIWGGTAGGWNRETVKMDEMELMVISRK